LAGRGTRRGGQGAMEATVPCCGGVVRRSYNTKKRKDIKAHSILERDKERTLIYFLRK
jgi:hypothetical protein